MVTVYFPVNKDTLAANDKKALDGLAGNALGMKGYVIEVAGFADSTGNTDKNLELSQRRADAVVQYLAISHKIRRAASSRRSAMGTRGARLLHLKRSVSNAVLRPRYSSTVGKRSSRTCSGETKVSCVTDKPISFDVLDPFT
jgi:OmpA family